MVAERGEIWWAELPEPVGSSPGYEHPVVLIQADFLNRSAIKTLIGVVITTNINLAEMPGNVLIQKSQSGLPKDSVVNVTQIVTVDKSQLSEYVGTLSERKMEQIDEGLRLVLSL
ncbi:MAG: type II toxin-antitoxin system PemK/MazF family toxin [Pyrinomonadaceae bacterium]